MRAIGMSARAATCTIVVATAVCAAALAQKAGAYPDRALRLVIPKGTARSS